MESHTGRNIPKSPRAEAFAKYLARFFVNEAMKGSPTVLR
jgi:hypothetical protein